MVDVAGQVVVSILTRAPSAGGKTRLFAALGRPADPSLLEALLLDTLDAVPASLARVVFYTPASREGELRELLPRDVGLAPQRGDDLGSRMRAAFDDLFAAGAAAAIVIGSDLPALDPAVIAAAESRLRDRPGAVVLGPATDGGYYLIGATRTPGSLFADIAWSTGDVLAQTMARARLHGVPIDLLSPSSDVDGVEDLRRLEKDAPRAARTRAWWARNR